MADNKITRLEDFRLKRAVERSEAHLNSQTPALTVRTAGNVKVVSSEHTDKSLEGLSSNREDNILFMAITRDEALRISENPGKLEGMIAHFGHIVPVQPLDFPNYDYVKPSQEPLFLYTREREILRYELLVTDITMEKTRMKNGVIVLPARYHDEVSELDTLTDGSANPIRILLSTFEPTHTGHGTLCSQYMNSLIDEKIALPKYRYFARRALSEQIGIMMKGNSELMRTIPEFRQFIAECDDYMRTYLESYHDGKHHYHKPVDLKRQGKMTEGNVVHVDFGRV